jgi:hypothetical protein
MDVLCVRSIPRNSKGQFGKFVHLVRDGPIAVLRGGRPVGCFITPEEYEFLRALDDAYGVARA